MPNDDSPDLTKLDGDYQVLTELHGEGDSRVYLARHLRLNRDVTISVFGTTPAIGAEALAQFASDSQRLTDARHPHIVPVIDGIWLDDRTFAVVRARVRGATLDQSLSATGPMSIARVASAVHDIVEALAWARETGIAQREIAPWDIVFQQGSGRLLIAFEPAKNAGVTRTECDDARTVRRLAVEMLAGEIDRNVQADDIVVPRGIPSDVADALAAMRYCTVRNASSAIAALSSALDANATRNSADERAQTASAIAPAPSSASIVVSRPEREIPTSVERSADAARSIPVVTSIPHRRKSIPAHRDDAVVVMKPAFGFNARLATAIAVVAAVGVIGIVALNHKETPQTVSAVVPTDTARNAAGEVALHAVPPRQAAPVSATIDSARAKLRTTQPRSEVTTADSGARVGRSRNPTDSVATPKKRVVLDSAAEAERQFQRDSAADAADPCLSSESTNQRRCLMESIDRNDRELNRVYARLIAALRRQGGAASADPDPETVNDLRTEQRKWVDTRDAECRDVGEEPLYARSRAACFAQKSADRARELQRRLDGLPPN